MLIVAPEAFSYLMWKLLISIIDSSLIVMKFVSSANCSNFVSFLFGIFSPCMLLFFLMVHWLTPYILYGEGETGASPVSILY